MTLSSKSWKTTSAGILTIVSSLVNLWFTRKDLNQVVVMIACTNIVTGIGLIVSRDNDKTSEDVGATTKPQNVNPKP